MVDGAGAGGVGRVDGNGKLGPGGDRDAKRLPGRCWPWVSAPGSVCSRTSPPRRVCLSRDRCVPELSYLALARGPLSRVSFPKKTPSNFLSSLIPHFWVHPPLLLGRFISCPGHSPLRGVSVHSPSVARSDRSPASALAPFILGNDVVLSVFSNKVVT